MNKPSHQDQASAGNPTRISHKLSVHIYCNLYPDYIWAIFDG
ncbi:hypothetical protein [Moorena producens]|nr:hypothetical protein [Moorena producens]